MGQPGPPQPGPATQRQQHDRAYTYDPLDRLHLVDYGGADRVRFRYAGLTTSAVQTIDDQTWRRHRATPAPAGPASRSRTGPARAATCASTGSTATTTSPGPRRVPGPSAGTVRYDPWGTATSVTGSVPDVRFQSGWADDTTKLSWVVTRWYAPDLGRFISEDSLLGEPRDPDSRHLYAYGAGEPVGRWDPDGRFWYRVQGWESWAFVERWFGVTRSRVRQGNPGGKVSLVRVGLNLPRAGTCIWLPTSRWFNQCNVRRGDWDAGRSGNLYWRWDGILSFMTQQMNKNVDYMNNKYTDSLSRTLNMRGEFIGRVAPGRSWDSRSDFGTTGLAAMHLRHRYAVIQAPSIVL